MSSSIAVVAPLGSNPAPLTELIWALVHDQGHRVTAITAVVEPAGHAWLCSELLMPGGPWDALADALGDRCPPCEALDIRVASPTQPYDATVWTAARDALEATGDRPIVFALAAGRTRTMTAAATVIFQLLARPEDRLVDVRVSDRRVEGGTGFFFPTQSSPVHTPRAVIDPATVTIDLVDVTVPRLRGFLADTAIDTWQDAVLAGQAMLDQTAPPRLHVDLNTGTITANEERLPLSHARTAWYATLAAERLTPTRPDGWIDALDDAPLARILSAAGPWAEATRCSWMDELCRRGSHTNPQSATKLRSTTSSQLARLAAVRPTLRLLVPEKRRLDHAWSWRLPLPPQYIRFAG